MILFQKRIKALKLVACSELVVAFTICSVAAYAVRNLKLSRSRLSSRGLRNGLIWRTKIEETKLQGSPKL
jgi:hypothetical protein